MTELPDSVFRLLLSIATGGFSAIWLIVDAMLLFRMRRADRGDPRVGDRRFGYCVGIVIATIGVVGTLRFNGLL